MEADVDGTEPKAEQFLGQLLPLPYRVSTLLVLGKHLHSCCLEEASQKQH